MRLRIDVVIEVDDNTARLIESAGLSIEEVISRALKLALEERGLGVVELRISGAKGSAAERVATMYVAERRRAEAHHPSREPIPWKEVVDAIARGDVARAKMLIDSRVSPSARYTCMRCAEVLAEVAKDRSKLLFSDRESRIYIAALGEKIVFIRVFDHSCIHKEFDASTLIDRIVDSVKRFVPNGVMRRIKEALESARRGSERRRYPVKEVVVYDPRKVEEARRRLVMEREAMLNA